MFFFLFQGLKLDEFYMNKLVTFYHLLYAFHIIPFFLMVFGAVSLISALFFTYSKKSIVSSILNSANKIKSVQNHVAESGVYPNQNVKNAAQELSSEASNMNGNNEENKGQATYTTLSEYRSYRQNINN